MRQLLLCAAILAAIPVASAAQDHDHPDDHSSAQDIPLHPAEVALVDEGDRGSVYRQFPSGLRLYTSEADPVGQSACYDGCASAWPPVVAPDDADTIGEWTVLERDDGVRQWMLRGKPVYVRYHDAPSVPTGDGIQGIWHLVPYQDDNEG